jgi:hypothetical protein
MRSLALVAWHDVLEPADDSASSLRFIARQSAAFIDAAVRGAREVGEIVA